MRVSFDLDGTVWKYPKYFGWLAKIHQAGGDEVGILTAHGEKLKEADLKLLQSRCGLKPDFFICKDENTWIKERFLSDGDWKAEMVLRHEIHLHYDDFDHMKPDYHKQYRKDFEDGISYYGNHRDQPLFVVVT